MAHLIIEYSANVADVADVPQLVDAVHDAALATGIASLDALRTRAVAREHYAIADRDPSNKFIAVTARLGAGRSDDEKDFLVVALMDALDAFLGESQNAIMLSVEYQEIDPARRINKNNLRAVVAERSNKSEIC
jgi:5-carboxymethyl-2-hydroxymuconate isomerase